MGKVAKPHVEAAKPVDIRNGADFIGQQKLMSDMILLALQTDSTRFVSFHLGGSGGVVPLREWKKVITASAIMDAMKISWRSWRSCEQEIVSTWGQFLRELSAIDEVEW